MARIQNEREQQALEECKHRVAKLGLDMRPLVAQVNPDANRIIIYFRAEQRVDFRELVRGLSRALKSRVELRQVGPRDQGKLVGHLGMCGYPLCCQTFLRDFAGASIKMAKQQDLVLNPMKISGICGRLLCCLSFEHADYAALKQKMPRVNQEVSTRYGKGKVIGLNLVKEKVSVRLEDQTVRELTLDQLTWQ
ncbi:MAG: PSP1 domain-containing protein [Chloroflexota bacterium]|jgi:cell fate regulator YaaT (PSP1 superfamily)